MCAENVLRLAAIDCSSPMSAKIDLNGVNWLPGSTGIRSPACAITASRPIALSATVLPPVFGPEITSARVGGDDEQVRGDDGVRRRIVEIRTAGMSSGCRAPRNSMRPSVASPGAMPSSALGEADLRVQLVEVRAGVERALEVVARDAETRR